MGMQPALPIEGVHFTEIFGRVLSAAEIKSAASGYFLRHRLLFWKWVVLDSDCVGDVFQLVVSSGP